MPWFHLLLAVLFLTAVLVEGASALPGISLSSPVRTGGDAPWHLTADHLESLDDGVIVEASGDVVLTRGEDYLKADFARYYKMCIRDRDSVAYPSISTTA